MLLIESDWFAFRETSSGLFAPARIEWVPWLPDGMDVPQSEAYLRSLRGSK
jgi:hypothetical protein